MHIERVTAENLKPIIREMVDETAHLMTDTGSALRGDNSKSCIFIFGRKPC